MTAARPFRMLDDLLNTAEILWKSVDGTKNTETMIAGLKRLLER
jgi:hypothetical protein